MRIGDILELEILRLSDAGKAIANAPDGRIVFVRGCGPGDVVDVALTKVRKRWAEGRLTRRISAGPHAVEPFCPLVDQCGGCPWQGVEIDVQREALVAHVSRLLTRAAGETVEVTCVGTEPVHAWRSTARLHWRAGRIGYHLPGGQRVLDVEACPILAPPLPALYAAVRAQLPLTGRGSMRLTAAPGASSGTVSLDPAKSPSAELVTAARQLINDPSCHGVQLGTLQFGKPTNRLGPLEVPHPAGAFVQAHQPGNAELVTAAVAACGEPGRVVELFAGSGNFSLALAAAGHRVLAIEVDRAAVKALAAEAERRGLPIKTRIGDAAQLPDQLPKVALIDPPRVGAAEAVAALHAAGVERIVYVACAPASLARDVAWLAQNGWRVASAQAFDLFPHTGHVETLVVLERLP